jgi:hypothetical protein
VKWNVAATPAVAVGPNPAAMRFGDSLGRVPDRSRGLRHPHSSLMEQSDIGPGCEQSINRGVKRALEPGKIVQRDGYYGEHRATPPSLACVHRMELKNKSLLHIPSSTRSGKKRRPLMDCIQWMNNHDASQENYAQRVGLYSADAE